MKSRGQRTDGGRRKTEDGCRTFDFKTFRPSTARCRAGFTFVELLLAVTISVMVFFAMGMVLTKCFSLWKDATANWRLAQYARISRERILCGGFANPSGGLLSATNVTLYMNGNWDYFQYGTVAGSGVTQLVCGWGDEDDENTQYGDPVYGNLLLRLGASEWAFAQSVANYSYSYNTPVKVDSFAASITNDILLISYRLKFSAAGKTFTLPHTIQACLVNKE